MRLLIAGLAHGHAFDLLSKLPARRDVRLVGIAEADEGTCRSYKDEFDLRGVAFGSDLALLLDRELPEAVAAFTTTAAHVRVVESCATRGTSLMMEKPFAASFAEAQIMAEAARRSGITVLVNYETNWRSGVQALWRLFKADDSVGRICKFVSLSGHAGPKRIHARAEFVRWLTDPAKSGGGALFDFGCYGVNLITWLMDNERPQSVTACAKCIRADLHEGVDDDAIVILEYPGASALVQGSWNLPHATQEFRVCSEHAGCVIEGSGEVRFFRQGGSPAMAAMGSGKAPEYVDCLSYLKAIVHGARPSFGPPSLENNIVVSEVLDAALLSAATSRTVRLRDVGPTA